jgi:hypothetical protein
VDTATTTEVDTGTKSREGTTITLEVDTEISGVDIKTTIDWDIEMMQEADTEATQEGDTEVHPEVASAMGDIPIAEDTVGEHTVDAQTLH